ncbi:MAG: pirin family protein [Acidimicrobiales bacterium]
MPAVTIEDTSALAHLSVPAATAVQRPVRSVTTAPRGLEGEGFPVHRAFAGVDLVELDPFVHLDQMGDVEYAPGEPKGTPWHPHRGFETVTYMIDGVMQHQDSTGGGGVIHDGGTQWMTAGKGILHIEAPPEDLVASGGWFHGLQLWVNLPRAEKWVDPRYQDLDSGAVEVLSSPDGGAVLRVIAGEIDGHRGPGSTHTPMAMVHATLAPGAQVVVPWPKHFNALVYVLAGDGLVGRERRPIKAGQLTVLGPGDVFTLEASTKQHSRTAALELLLLGGEPIREPVAMYGPFVMNSKTELREAYEDFEAGRLGTIPASHVVPLARTAPKQTDAAPD